MGIEERKNREREEMRNLILKTAMKLFLDDGIENVSLRKIADVIEYSPASIYSYFKDKGEIVYALHDEGFEKLYKMQTSLNDISNPLERLRQMGQIYMKFALENRDYYDLMFIAKGIGDEICNGKQWGAGLRSYDYLRNTIKECIEQEYFIEADVDAVTFVYWSLVHGMASLIIKGRCSMMPDDIVNRIVSEGLSFIYKSTNLKSPKSINK